MGSPVRSALITGSLVALPLLGGLAVACSSDASAADSADASLPDAFNPSDAAAGGDAPDGPDATAPRAPEPSDGAQSGSRLKILNWQTPDGFRVWSGSFFDTALNQECIAARWTDGVVRCTPPTQRLQQYRRGWFDWKPPFQEANAPTDAGFVEYANGDCTGPFAVMSTGIAITAQTFAVELAPRACFVGNSAYGPYMGEPDYDVAHVYSVGAPRSDQNGYLNDLGTGCGFHGALYPGNPFELGAEVPPSTFVDLTETVAPSTDAITTTSLGSADGVKLPKSLRSTTFTDDCYLKYAYGSRSATCVPQKIASLAGYSYYADAACQAPLAPLPKTCDPPHGVWDTWISASDFYAATFYLAGPAAPVVSIADGAGACHTGVGPDADAFWSLGAKTTLPTVTRTHDDLAGWRLQLVHVTTGSYVGRDVSTVYDVQKKVECALARDASGVVYCEPRGCGETETLYPDAACQSSGVPVYVHLSYADPNIEPECAALPVPTHVGRRQVMGALAGTYNRLVNTAPGAYECRPAAITSRYALGPEIPLTEFVTFSKLAEP